MAKGHGSGFQQSQWGDASLLTTITIPDGHQWAWECPMPILRPGT